jgi:hypothetical protein
MHVIEHRVVTDWLSAPFLCLFIEGFQEVRAKGATNVRLSGVSGPNEMIEESMEGVGHGACSGCGDVAEAKVKPRKTGLDNP